MSYVGTPIFASALVALSCGLDDSVIDPNVGSLLPPIGVSVVSQFSGNGSEVFLESKRIWDLAVLEINTHGGIAGRELVFKPVDARINTFADLEQLQQTIHDELDAGAKFVMSALLSPELERKVMADVLSYDAIAVSLVGERTDSNLGSYSGRLIRMTYPYESVLFRE